jgi:hypothetical protein
MVEFNKKEKLFNLKGIAVSKSPPPPSYISLKTHEICLGIPNYKMLSFGSS